MSLKGTVKARPGDFLKSLPTDQQIAATEEFLQRAGDAAQNDPAPKARAKAGIGVVTAREFPDTLKIQQHASIQEAGTA